MFQQLLVKHIKTQAISPHCQVVGMFTLAQVSVPWLAQTAAAFHPAQLAMTHTAADTAAPQIPARTFRGYKCCG
jgi:hypothetical protein